MKLFLSSIRTLAFILLRVHTTSPLDNLVLAFKLEKCIARFHCVVQEAVHPSSESVLVLLLPLFGSCQEGFFQYLPLYLLLERWHMLRDPRESKMWVYFPDVFFPKYQVHLGTVREECPVYFPEVDF